MGFITKLISMVFGGTSVADTVANVGKGIGLVVFIPSAIMWLQGHGNEGFHVITYGELAFWGLIGYAFVQVGHKAP